MSKVRLGDLSNEERKNYQYYKRLLRDFYIYGPHYIEKIANEQIGLIERKYGNE